VVYVGTAALWLALGAALYVCIGGLIGAGRRERGAWLLHSVRRAAWMLCGTTALAAVALAVLLGSRRFDVLYVYHHTSTVQPAIYNLAALWAGQEGSLLFWALAASVSAVVLSVGGVGAEERGADARFTTLALSTLGGVTAFFLFLLAVVSNPFALASTVPQEGFGLNPLLRNWAMLLHPPLILIGYAAYTVPFGFALAAWIAGDGLDAGLMRSLRRWSLFAWGTLGAGILLGAWWAYVELGWGGYWSWDPVENASLIPWLTGTALLHSIRAREGHAAFEGWVRALSWVTFVLCLVATFIARGGSLVQSVHTFAASPLSLYLGAAVGLLVLVPAAMAVRRRLRSTARAGRDEPELVSLVSREAAFLLTNLLLVGAAAIVLLGTLFPWLARAASGRDVVLRTSFFGRATGPLAAVLLGLLGVCPLRRRGRLAVPAGGAAAVAILLVLGGAPPLAVLGLSLAAFVALSALVSAVLALRGTAGDGGLRLLFRRRKLLGAYLVHLGVACMAAGVIGSSTMESGARLSIPLAGQVTVGRYALAYEGLSYLQGSERDRALATVSVYRVRRGQVDAAPVAVLHPEVAYYWIAEQRVSEVAVRSTWIEDLYVALVDWSEEGAVFYVLLHPLLIWLWIGGGLILGGAIGAGWPPGRRAGQGGP
jgi:cytochrome c-type biogenesis protein CcmF